MAPKLHLVKQLILNNIRSSLKKKKGTHSHCTMQQVTVDAPASCITDVPIQHILWAKVIAEDLINLQSRPGSPSTLVMTASESTSSHGRDGRSGKREPWPPPELRALTDITGSTPSGSGMAARKDGEEADRLEPGISQLTVIISEESDFAADRYQMIPTDKCFGLPIVLRQSGGFKLNYKDAVKVTDFWGIYYFELGYLRPGYTNAMPYNHPLDWQGHIASVLHSGVAVYSLYIRLITLGILLPQKKEVPYPNQRLIPSGAVCTSFHWFWMSSCLAMIWETSCLILQQVNMGSTSLVHPVSTFTRCM